ncbi:MAG: GNAT family N-acetyltransferase [Acidimicrobiia bacterium]
MDVTVRGAIAADSERLQSIEREAGEQFRSVGLGAVADHAPFSVDELVAYVNDGRSWVATEADAILGYVVVDRVGRAAHVEQVSVVPEAQGRGIGRRLMDQAHSWARTQGFDAITLTTFRDVSWNAPLYAHLGYRPLGEDELSDALRALRDEEAEHGLDPATRVCMRLDL